MPGTKKRWVTAAGGREVHPVDSTRLVCKKDFQGLNMSGSSPVRVVRRNRKKK